MGNPKRERGEAATDYALASARDITKFPGERGIGSLMLLVSPRSRFGFPFAEKMSNDRLPIWMTGPLAYCPMTLF